MKLRDELLKGIVAEGKALREAIEEDFIRKITEPEPVSQIIKDYAKRLFEEYMGVTLAYREDYDVLKYQGRLPISDSKFETHANKWHFIELAKFFQENHHQNNLKVHETDYLAFLAWMYGEGFREPVAHKVDWTQSIRTQTGLADVFGAWQRERLNRYAHLEQNLNKMRINHDIHILQDFKTFITCPKTHVEPPMWYTIGYKPEVRGNNTYTLTLQSFILLDSYLHLLDAWHTHLAGEPEWDANYMRLKTYRKLYTSIYPINTMTVRKVINTTMKLK